MFFASLCIASARLISKSPFSTPLAAFASIWRSCPVVLSSFFTYSPFKFVYVHGQFVYVSHAVHVRGQVHCTCLAVSGMVEKIFVPFGVNFTPPVAGNLGANVHVFPGPAPVTNDVFTRRHKQAIWVNIRHCLSPVKNDA